MGFKTADSLAKGEQLYFGQQLTSRNRRFKAVMQLDGNFVLFAGERPLWATNTVGRGYRVMMQRDGSLILSDKDRSPLWVVDTLFEGNYLICQDDGNLALYLSNRTLFWSTKTTQSNFKSLLHN